MSEATSPEDARLILGLAERVLAQSELLANRVVKQQGTGLSVLSPERMCVFCRMFVLNEDYAAVELSTGRMAHRSCAPVEGLWPKEEELTK